MPGLWIKQFRKLAEQIDRGAMTLEEAGKILVEGAASGSFVDEIIEKVSGLFDGPRLPIFFALATGRKDGKPARVATTVRAIPPGMARATGIPLALGTRLHLQGRVAAKGVMAPEKAFQPAEFFDLLAPYCTHPAPVEASELVEVASEPI